jgi:hypothetical protein
MRSPVQGPLFVSLPIKKKKFDVIGHLVCWVFFFGGGGGSVFVYFWADNSHKQVLLRIKLETLSCPTPSICFHKAVYLR